MDTFPTVKIFGCSEYSAKVCGDLWGVIPSDLTKWHLAAYINGTETQAEDFDCAIAFREDNDKICIDYLYINNITEKKVCTVMNAVCTWGREHQCAEIYTSRVHKSSPLSYLVNTLPMDKFDCCWDLTSERKQNYQRIVNGFPNIRVIDTSLGIPEAVYTLMLQAQTEMRQQAFYNFDGRANEVFADKELAVFFIDDKPVGLAAFYYGSEKPIVHNPDVIKLVYVEPPYRNRGIGTVLIFFAEACFNSSNIMADSSYFISPPKGFLDHIKATESGAWYRASVVDISNACISKLDLLTMD